MNIREAFPLLHLKIRGKMKKAILSLLFAVSAVWCAGQNPDSLRNAGIDKLSMGKLETLVEAGLLSESELPFFGRELLKMIQDGMLTDTMTVGQTVDLFRVRKKQREELVAQANDSGKDIVYIRMPAGDKICIGTGEMSLEKLVLREARGSFPVKYGEPGHDARMTAENMRLFAAAVSDLVQSDEIAGMLVGNAMLIIPECGLDLSEYRIGDLVEIGKRIRNSREFAPFIRILNSAD